METLTTGQVGLLDHGARHSSDSCESSDFNLAASRARQLPHAPPVFELHYDLDRTHVLALTYIAHVSVLDVCHIVHTRFDVFFLPRKMGL